jgi:hypothetical protein
MSWIGSLHLGRFRQGISFGPEDFRSRSRGPVIVTEQQADPVELLYQAFRRLDAEQRRRLLGRIARSELAPREAWRHEGRNSRVATIFNVRRWFQFNKAVASARRVPWRNA